MQPRRSTASSPNGFTIIELLVTLAVAAILLTVAVPAMQGTIQRNTLTVTSNKLIHALHFARSEAIKQSQDIVLCKSRDGISCTTNGDWSQGWIIYAPQPDGATVTTDNLLRVQNTLETQIKITGNSHVENDIAFGALGFAHGSNGTLTVVIKNTSRTIDIVISNTGRIRTEIQ